MLGKTVTKLIIVCDEKTKEYANYLRQLISANDDKDDGIVGIVDGSVEAAVWLEKEYLANSATLSSNEHVLFVGSYKASKSEISSMKVKYYSYGMKYGWLGKRAMMQVDDTLLNESDYNAFIAFCTAYEQKFEKLAYNSPKKLPEKKKVSREEFVKANAIEFDDNANNKKHENVLHVGAAGAVVAAAILSPVVAAAAALTPIVAAGVVAVEVYAGLSVQSVHKKIKDQQYRALTVIFYMDGLQKFLEG